MPNLDEDGFDLDIIYRGSPEMRTLYTKAVSDADKAIAQETQRFRATLKAKIAEFDARNFGAEFDAVLTTETDALSADFARMQTAAATATAELTETIRQNGGNATIMKEAAEKLAGKVDQLQTELEAAEAKVKQIGGKIGQLAVTVAKKAILPIL